MNDHSNPTRHSDQDLATIMLSHIDRQFVAISSSVQEILDSVEIFNRYSTDRLDVDQIAGEKLVSAIRDARDVIACSMRRRS